MLPLSGLAGSFPDPVGDSQRGGKGGGGQEAEEQKLLWRSKVRESKSSYSSSFWKESWTRQSLRVSVERAQQLD